MMMTITSETTMMCNPLQSDMGFAQIHRYFAYTCSRIKDRKGCYMRCVRICTEVHNILVYGLWNMCFQYIYFAFSALYDVGVCVSVCMYTLGIMDETSMLPFCNS